MASEPLGAEGLSPEAPPASPDALNPAHSPALAGGTVAEAELEPLELIRQSHLVHRTGRMVLASGHGSYRVKAHMQRVGAALGLDAVKAHVALTEITTTAERGGLFRTEVSEVRTVGINADRLAELEEYVGGLPAQVSDADLEAELDRIAAKPPLYAPWFNAAAAGLACAAFALLNGGGWLECLLVLFSAALGQLLRRHLIRRGVNQVGVTMLAASVSCTVYLLLINGVGLLTGDIGQHAAGFISAILYLVPGFPLVTSALDLARLDLSAGISRLAYALMILASAAISLWGVSALAGVEPQVTGPLLHHHHQWVLAAAASFAGVLGFAIIFNSPWRMALGAAAVGMVCNVFRLALLHGWGWEPQAAAAVAALLVGLSARAIATPLGVPRLTISVPAVVIMVPGVTAYRAVFEANAGDPVSALAYTFTAALIVLGLAVGLGVARMLTDHEWTFEQPT